MSLSAGSLRQFRRVKRLSEICRCGSRDKYLLRRFARLLTLNLANTTTIVFLPREF